ncbi:hypothetical protein DAI22_02g212600 [Oryza sativa Japonica Group]|nr:hypothetical protein DAI22_02g212600 [Oryza sativa Japonica Group]
MGGATSPAAPCLSVCLLPLLFLFLHGCWSCVAIERERTLAMIKPDGLSGNYTERIKEVILESGFDIVKEAVVQLDAERASLFYAEHSGRSFFDSLVKYMTRYLCRKTCVFCSLLKSSQSQAIVNRFDSEAIST